MLTQEGSRTSKALPLLECSRMFWNACIAYDTSPLSLELTRKAKTDTGAGLCSCAWIDAILAEACSRNKVRVVEQQQSPVADELQRTQHQWKVHPQLS